MWWSRKDWENGSSTCIKVNPHDITIWLPTLVWHCKECGYHENLVKCNSVAIFAANSYRLQCVTSIRPGLKRRRWTSVLVLRCTRAPQCGASQYHYPSWVVRTGTACRMSFGHGTWALLCNILVRNRTVCESRFTVLDVPKGNGCDHRRVCVLNEVN